MKDKKVEELSFEEALNALEKTVESLSDGSTKLEEIVDLYEKGASYLQQCRAKLKDVEARLSILSAELPEKKSGDE